MNTLIPMPLVDGCDLLNEQRRVSPLGAVLMKNLVPTRPGFLTTRPGVAWFSEVLADAQLPIALGFPPFNDAFAVLATRNLSPIPIPSGADIAVSNTVIHVVPNPGPTAGTLPAEIATQKFDMGTPTLVRPVLLALRDKMYCFGGYAAQSCLVQVAGGAVVAQQFFFLGNGNGPQPQVATSYKQRAAYFNFGPGFESVGIFSDNYKPDTIGDNALGSRALALAQGDGDRIVAAVEIMQTGSQARAYMLIMKEFSTFAVSGEPNQSTDVSSFINTLDVVRLPLTCGCSSAETVVQTPYGILWAGPDDVWLFHDGQLPRRVGSKIRSRLALTNPSFRYLWHAAYYNGFYRLAIQSPQQSAINDDMKMGEQWWLDLRDGPPESHQDAKWYGPQVYSISNRQLFQPAVGLSTDDVGTRCMAIDPRPRQQQALYGLDVCQPTSVSLTARRVEMYVLDADLQYDVGIDVLSPAVGAFAGALADSPNGEVAIDFLTRDYASLGWTGQTGAETQEDPIVDKLINGLEMAIWVSQPCQLSVDYILDGGRAVKTFTKIISQKGTRLSVDALDAATGPSEEFQAISVSPGATRNVGKYYQFRVYVTPGYVIDSSNDELAFDENGAVFVVTLTQGFYADLKAFADHVIVAKMTHQGVNYSHNVVSAVDQRSRISTTNDRGLAWKFLFSSVGQPITPAQAAKTRVIGGYLGYDTEYTGARLLIQTAETGAPWRLAPKVEFGQININIRPDRRRPL
jgi:hypothetical protein